MNSTSKYDFQNLEFIKSIKKAKFSVYLVRSLLTNELLALKMFPFLKGNILSYYRNEARFANLSHRNIIQILYAEDQKIISQESGTQGFSYTVMEYAPYGDFLDILTSHSIPITDKLVRTYFHQLIEGIEYMHSQGAAHLDIKPENLLIGKNFLLKIVDFDLSFFKGDNKIKANGTKDFRAPELMKNYCSDPEAADIFSAGIILFLLASRGVKPYTEQDPESKIGLDLYLTLQEKEEEFWNMHSKNKHASEAFDQDFKILFTAMTKVDPNQRASISDVKNSNWYQREIYHDEELCKVMKESLKVKA